MDYNQYYLAQVPNEPFEIIFEGGYDDVYFMPYLRDDSPCYRLQGHLSDFVNCSFSEITLDEFSKEFNVISSEYIIGGGTMYYVSDYFVVLRIDTDNDNKPDVFMDISVDEANSNIIKKDAAVYLYWHELYK